jgi:hypothetical protein
MLTLLLLLLLLLQQQHHGAAAQHSGVFPKADTLWFSRGKHAPSRAWLIAALERIEASERKSAAKSARVDDRARARVEAERRAKALEKAGAARG